MDGLVVGLTGPDGTLSLVDQWLPLVWTKEVCLGCCRNEKVGILFLLVSVLAIGQVQPTQACLVPCLAGPGTSQLQLGCGAVASTNFEKLKIKFVCVHWHPMAVATFF